LRQNCADYDAYMHFYSAIYALKLCIILIVSDYALIKCIYRKVD
jgi:hypothetical protein